MDGFGLVWESMRYCPSCIITPWDWVVDCALSSANWRREALIAFCNCSSLSSSYCSCDCNADDSKTDWSNKSSVVFSPSSSWSLNWLLAFSLLGTVSRYIIYIVHNTAMKILWMVHIIPFFDLHGSNWSFPDLHLNLKSWRLRLVSRPCPQIQLCVLHLLSRLI